ncbi:restriction endonuclease subunit S [candidate division KSB1 bacterium]|nr:restriction endonuclease subunit S [candidate division KSB1 bacterium]
MTKQTKNIPQLRFREFDDVWTEEKLGTLLSFKNGLNAVKEKYGKGIKFINVLDIINNRYINYANIIGKVEVSESELQKNRVEYGDVLFQRSSETREEVGQANVYLDKERCAIFGGFVIRGHKKQAYDPMFMNMLLKTWSARKEITTRSGGSTRYNIGQDSLEVVKINFPSLPEQQKIASFLSAIDRKIQQLTRKKELFEQYKKGVMQKIFSREIRFKNENGKDYPDWSKSAFRNIVEKSGCKHNPKLDSNDLPCIELESIEKENGALIKVFSSKDQKSIKNMFKNGDVLFGKLRPNLKKYLMPVFDGVCSSEIWVLKGKEIDNLYLFYLVQSDYFYRISTITSGSKMPRADWDYISSCPVHYPCSQEQRKIASFLSAIDKKIESIQSQITQTQSFKKGLLQRMFV